MSKKVSAERLERLIHRPKYIRILTIALTHYLIDSSVSFTARERERVQLTYERNVGRKVRREMVNRLARIAVNSNPAASPDFPSENVAVKRVFNGQGMEIFNCIVDGFVSGLGDERDPEIQEYARRRAAGGMIKFAEEMDRNPRADPSELRLALVG